MDMTCPRCRMTAICDNEIVKGKCKYCGDGIIFDDRKEEISPTSGPFIGWVSLVAAWRERAKLAWQTKEDRCGGKISPEGNDYAMHATTLEMCANELEGRMQG